ncbi:ATP-binding protein [Muribaculum sp. NM65_B17]|uniref:ATP-binding protein n=1 Tax=Muribaculum sp. NM65_B17 TaxID=2516961 RepID=UPI001093AF36|nr:ATP-binding protein [Muribaculum sp. NM65_B17]TGY05026.1 response regulator [Muribaculum sp. NM65_B17]THG44736.1 response regulator [Muribaculaceae bacterium]
MSQLIRVSLLCIIASLSPIISSASIREWRKLTIDNGLLSNQVYSIDMDDDGIIWLPTRYGIISYDGTRAKAHLPLSAHTTPKMYNDVLSLCSSGDGKIYFVTALTFGVYDKHRNKFEPIMLEGVEFYKSISRLDSGELLIVCNNNIIIYDPVTSEYHALPDDGGFNRSGISAIYQDRIGQIWIGTDNNGILRYSPHERKTYQYPGSSHLSTIKCIYQDSHDRLYAGTQSSGLYRMNEPYTSSKSSLERMAPEVLDGKLPVCDMIESVNNRQMWIGTDGGILSFDIDSFNPVEAHNDINATVVSKFWADDSGIIWAATSNSGVYFMDTAPRRFDYCDSLRPKLPAGLGNTVSVYEDRQGTLWSGGLNYPVAYNTKGSRHWDTPSSIFDYPRAGMPTIFTMTEDSKGNIYYGCWNDIICRDITTGAVTHIRPSESKTFPGNNIMRLKADSKDNIWVGTTTGFCAITPDRQTFTFSDKGDVMGICENGDNVYVATLNDGIFSIDTSRPLTADATVSNSRVTAEKGFQPVILSIAPSRRKGLLYIGTEDEGLWTYNAENGEYTLTDYVPRHSNLQVAFIHEDRHGMLWIATNRGLYHINTEKPAERKFYTVYDGLKSDYFIYNGTPTDSLLYLPTYNNFEIIDIESAYNDTLPCNSIRFGFTGMHFNNRPFEELSPEERESISGDQLPEYSRDITIPHELSNFSIGFNAYNYRNPKRIPFKYKLEGYDDEWQPSPNDRLSATYTNLSPGTYTFRLRAGNENGQWSTDEHSIRIRILPPWYLSWPAICLYVLLAAALVIMFIRIVRKRERVKAWIQLMQKEKENLEEINRTKLRFFTNVTHELLTPLTVISAAISELRNGHCDEKALCRTADINVSKLVRLLQQILEFRKVETDNIKLRVNYGDISRFVTNTVEAVRPLTLRKSMKMEVNMPQQPVMGYFDPDKLDKILYNLISNASKYSDENGVITVDGTLTHDLRQFIIKVSDTGRGIPKSKQANLFKRFYDGDYREQNTQGTGIGLSLTRDLVELSHGTITVESEEGKGTCFTITIPITAEAFSDDEISVMDVKADDTHEADINDSVVDDDDDDNDINEPEETTPDPESKAKILVIEDNEDLLLLMQQVLERNYEVITASDGMSGLEMAFNDSPDLIITDLTMPGIDGLEMIRRLRNDSRTSLRPIVVLSARRQNEDRTECYEAGVDVYLPKPFDPAMLKACIATQLNSHRQMLHDNDGQLVINMKKCDFQSADMQFLNLATEVVERNIDKTEFDIPTFAREVGMSQTHLFRKLKELTNMSPSHFIRTIRLRNACHILTRHPDIRVSELAFMVGFSDARYFSKCFKSEFGVTPGEYKSTGA